MSSPPPVSPELSQELYDLIIDQLHDSPPDLKSCALVRTSFLPHAQTYLFHTISIPPPPPGPLVWAPQDTDQAKALVAVRRLVDCFQKTSPHLLPYVRKLAISFNRANPEILALLAPIGFPSLETLHLFSLPSGDYTRTLLGTPSLLDVTLDFALLIWTRAQIRDFLASFAPGVQKIHLCQFKFLPPTTDVDTEPMSVVPGAKPVIRDLSISSCQSLLPLLAAPDGPFDLRSLKTLTLTEESPSHKPIAPLNEFLQSIGRLYPVDVLHIICDPERLNLLDLSCLSPTTSLHISFHNFLMSPWLATLALTPLPTRTLISHVSINLMELLAMEYPWDAPTRSMYDSLDELKLFQQLLLHGQAGMLFPHLQKVDVAVVILEPDPAQHILQWAEVSGPMEGVVREELKELEQRGMLAVRCVQMPNWRGEIIE
ncbi:hypothetical protein C8F01DRAFT_1265677 [Mycena amicta]|nr:hypothetical protein C8F01DRAFT_1265677 [Mycena amicta]